MEYFSFVQVILTCVLAMGARRPKSTEGNIVYYMDNSLAVCAKGICKEYSYSTINTSYQGVFYSVDEYSRKTGLPFVDSNATVCNPDNHDVREDKPNKRRKREGCSKGVSDFDLCCPTLRSFRSTTVSEFLINVDGEECYIIHIPAWNVRQFYTVGLCEHTNTCSGTGNCYQEDAITTLLSWNTNQLSLSFEMFHYPSYCSCKNIRRG